MVYAVCIPPGLFIFSLVWSFFSHGSQGSCLRKMDRNGSATVKAVLVDLGCFGGASIWSDI